MFPTKQPPQAPPAAVPTLTPPSQPNFAPAAQPSVIPQLLKGESQSVVGSNVNALKQSGQSEFDATRAAIQASQSGKPKAPRHKNLGKFLHPRKDGKTHGTV